MKERTREIMARYPVSGPYTDYRRVLSRKGDVALGGYARRQRRRNLLLAAAGLLLLGAAGWLFTNMVRRTMAEPASQKVPVVVRCGSCGNEQIVRILVDTAFPLVCTNPACGERACWKVWECRSCGNRFLRKGREPEIRCPNCGSDRVGSAEALPDRAPEAGGSPG